MSEGWKCPVCGAGKAPFVPECNHSQMTLGYGIVNEPVQLDLIDYLGGLGDRGARQERDTFSTR